jgi:hypothetical protein
MGAEVSPEKLDALRKLAMDERTPIDEARNAALQFVRHGGKFSMEPRPPTDDEIKAACTPERIRFVFRTDFESLKREQKEAISKAQTERDEAIRERDALKRQLEDLRSHGKALLSFFKAETEAAKPAKERPQKPINPFADWPFYDVRDPWKL